MKKYLITEKAGRRVAGVTNTGVGKLVTLSEEQAAAAVKAGELVLASEQPGAGAEAAQAADLSKLTKAELLGLAGELGVAADEKQTKAEIVAAIEAHKAKAGEA